MSKQTSIEWLEMELKKLPSIDVLKTFEQAKQMHKEEIVSAWNDGDYAYFYSKETGRDFADGAEYYQETYGGNKGGCGLDCSYPDCICQGNEITNCKNRTPEQVVLGYKTALVEGVFHQGLKKTAMQELIDEIVEHLTYDDDLSDDSRMTLETIRLRCLGKLSMEKDQIINTFKDAQVFKVVNDETRAEQYYNETYGSNHIVNTNEMIDHIGDANKMVETEEKPMRYHCVPKEISDEDIQIAGVKNSSLDFSRTYNWIEGAKWYREQLKK